MCYPPFFTFSWALLPRQPGLCKALGDCSMIQLRYMSSHAALQTISWANDNYPGGPATPITFFSPYQAESIFPLVTSCQRVPLGSGCSPVQGITLEMFIDGNPDAEHRLGFRSICLFFTVFTVFTTVLPLFVVHCRFFLFVKALKFDNRLYIT